MNKENKISLFKKSLKNSSKNSLKNSPIAAFGLLFGLMFLLVIAGCFPIVPITDTEQTDTEAVAAAKTTLAIDFATGDSSTNVTTDLTLPTNGSNGVAITWSSSDTSIIATNGVVIRKVQPRTLR